MDLKQFEIKILPLKNKIYRLAKALLGNATNAEDAVQDVYLKLWAQREQIEKADNIQAFCLQVARNYCLDRLRILRRVDFDELTDISFSTDRSPYEQVEQQDLAERIKKLMAFLPEQQRTVIHLRDVDDLEFEEITRITGMSENAIKVNLSRARQKIRELLNKENI
ncbi:RNA polymerase sigma factor [Microbacter margulisiae]|uniref:RNA polymerase sigma-70 factor (ECF subfamily) n=1 Tax=Microbacter margulisiae TaxID=1350067 RepID=A0A7W5DQK6_9PORP|nr:RNA polymerase sigma factor [Microbacter margulisiae]MBB3187259.1 RNA polymerase sigma-70 factor (ECF subfamily) [Microbacter margulisiae]